jgi:head-tail adaptor
MGFPSGKRDTRVTITRRTAVAAVGRAGNERGPFVAVFQRWANVKAERQSEIVEGGVGTDAPDVTVTLPDDSQTRTITAADRIIIHEQSFAIIGTDLPDRIRQIIVLKAKRQRGG